MSKTNIWEQFTEKVEEINAINGVIGLLNWDQHTHMPKSGIIHRGKQLATLAALRHDKITDKSFGDIIEEIGKNNNNEMLKKNAIRKMKRERDRSIKVPKRLVQELSKAHSKGVAAWAEAKKENHFPTFAPELKNIIELSKEYAACFGDAENLYDNLIDGFDQGMTVSKLDPMFQKLKPLLTDLVNERADTLGATGLELNVPVDVLNKLNHKVIEALGFDKSAGTLDISEHPFTCGLGPMDVRLTTHNHSDDILETLNDTIHECGHGLYEQGLPIDWLNNGLCSAAGCGIHESQSRFYENIIGRSIHFFRWLAPIIHQELPSIKPSAEELYIAANRVNRSLIRIYADESTYNLHIIVRYEIEKLLFNGSLSVDEIPEMWNNSYEKLIGIRPKTNTEGVLQDVHWAMGALGYFPSYTIGNLYSASYKAVMERDMPDIWNKVENGDFKDILTWHREHIHNHGCSDLQEVIVKNAVGERDHVNDLIQHLRQRQNHCDDFLNS